MALPARKTVYARLENNWQSLCADFDYVRCRRVVAHIPELRHRNSSVRPADSVVVGLSERLTFSSCSFRRIARTLSFAGVPLHLLVPIKSLILFDLLRFRARFHKRVVRIGMSSAEVSFRVSLICCLFLRAFSFRSRSLSSLLRRCGSMLSRYVVQTIESPCLRV